VEELGMFIIIADEYELKLYSSTY